MSIVHADCVWESEPESDLISTLTAHIYIVDPCHRNKGCGRHCSLGLFKKTVAGTLLWFAKKASIIVNFDADLTHRIFHSRLASIIQALCCGTTVCRTHLRWMQSVLLIVMEIFYLYAPRF